VSSERAALTLARIVRARGRAGEVAAEILTDFPERLTRLTEVLLFHPAAPDAAPRPARLRRAWLHKGQAIFHFEGCDSIADAEKLRGFEVRVPIGERMPLPPGKFYVTDLEGCEVWEGREAGEARETEETNAGRKASSVSDDSEFPPPSNAMEKPPASSASLASPASLLGVVRGVQFTGEAVAGTPLLVVETTRGELLIPLAEEICTRIDIAARRIEVRLPPGLREL
jgi:ribosomal 30S subunit maturation factor RimM